ncbi:hypothetical protein QA640_38575 [Bradyrhizobium sp. CB82]|uniref:hypothetical protein n=1 Tax=Bradyrhizobium sp. CB82 TaxID=3039159 RepID=UPI0024B26D3E|nr:hypothetical protein [Bradyrhizobium sp. CB82]WFU40069.1 hypothetical protein QA640_38575 [Bradyrhizobium sp. CB82]
MTASEIGAAILKAHGVEEVTPDEGASRLAKYPAQLANPHGKGVERVGEKAIPLETGQSTSK